MRFGISSNDAFVQLERASGRRPTRLNYLRWLVRMEAEPGKPLATRYDAHGICPSTGFSQRTHALCSKCEGRGDRLARFATVTLTLSCTTCDALGFLVYKPRRGRAWRRA